MRSVTRLALTLSLALLVHAASAAPALAAKAAVLTGYDSTTSTGGQATLRFKVERDSFIKFDLHGVTVEFRVGSTVIGTAVSGSDGYADLRVNAPQSAGDIIVTGAIPAGGKYAARDATLLLAVRDASARLIVVDIDWTICAAKWWDVLWKANSQLPPVKGAVSALNDLGKGATVLYLTARDDGQMRKTKSWLAYWGFPRGPLYCSDDPRVLIDPHPYKSATIRMLKGVFANMPCGFGNKNTDADAYHDNGLTTYLFDTENAGPYRSFAFVYKDWDDLRAAVAAGQRPELGWATSFR